MLGFTENYAYPSLTFTFQCRHLAILATSDVFPVPRRFSTLYLFFLVKSVRKLSKLNPSVRIQIIFGRFFDRL